MNEYYLIRNGGHMVKKYLKWIILALVLILGVVYFAFLRKPKDEVR